MRIFALVYVHEGLEFVSKRRDQLAVVAPLWFLKDVLEEEKLELVKEKLLGKYAEHALNEEGEVNVVSFVLESVVGENGHAVDDEAHFVIKNVFLVLQALVGVSLVLVHHLSLFPWFSPASHFLLLFPLRLMEVLKKGSRIPAH